MGSGSAGRRTERLIVGAEDSEVDLRCGICNGTLRLVGGQTSHSLDELQSFAAEHSTCEPDRQPGWNGQLL